MNKHDLNYKKALSGTIFTFLNYCIFYLIGLTFARRLGSEGYGDYTAAISFLSIATSLTMLGFGKSTLKMVPGYLAKKNNEKLHGYIRFSLFTVLLSSSFFTIVAIAIHEIYFTTGNLDKRHAFIIALFFLPIVSLASLLIEVLTGAGKYLSSTAVFRLVLPCSILGIGFWWVSADHWAIERAVLTYSASWMICFFLLLILTNAYLPGRLFVTRGLYEKKMWLMQALPFMANSLLIKTLDKSTVVIMELGQASEHSVGVYGACDQIGNLVILIAVSTNRLYVPQLAAMLEQNKFTQIMALLRKRIYLIATLGIVFMLLIILGGRQFLQMFGENFTDGYIALIIASFAATFSTIYSISPYILQFMGKQKQVILITAGCLISSISLTAFLSSYYGATGAAIGYGLPVIVAFFLMGKLSMNAIKQNGLKP